MGLHKWSLIKKIIRQKHSMSNDEKQQVHKRKKNIRSSYMKKVKKIQGSAGDWEAGWWRAC